MTQFLLIAFGVAVFAALLAVFVASAQAKRAARAEEEKAVLLEAFGEIRHTAERLHQALAETTKAKGVAHEERNDLAATLDGDLVCRANRLFVRM